VSKTKVSMNMASFNNANMTSNSINSNNDGRFVQTAMSNSLTLNSNINNRQLLPPKSPTSYNNNNLYYST
jgi:hypothetical protein